MSLSKQMDKLWNFQKMEYYYLKEKEEEEEELSSPEKTWRKLK